MLNLSRHGAGSPRRIFRWFQKPFEWKQLNWTALESSGVMEHDLIACLDCTFLSKSGTNTWGLAKFHSGVAGRSLLGLEACVLGVVDVDENTAYTIEAIQTPADLNPKSDNENKDETDKKETRVDFYVKHILNHSADLVSKGIRYIVADGYFAKKKVMEALQDTKLHLISKLRKDANARYFYEGPKSKGPGCPKKYDGKVNWDDLKLFEETQINEEVKLLSKKLNLKWPNCDVLVVVVVVRGKRQKILFTTDTKLAPKLVYKYYNARFQQEFVFRDAKQFVGLNDGQMRDEAKRHEHLNASLSALNMMRLEDRAEQKIEGKRVISMASWKRRKYAQHIAQRICSNLDLNPEQQKILSTLFSPCNHAKLAS